MCPAPLGCITPKPDLWEDQTCGKGRGTARKKIAENGGPHVTPLVTANGVYTAGILANLICLDKKTGSVLWSHDLYRELNGTPMDRGYSASPVAWKNTVIMKVGGAGHALVAFNQKGWQGGLAAAEFSELALLAGAH